VTVHPSFPIAIQLPAVTDPAPPIPPESPPTAQLPQLPLGFEPTEPPPEAHPVQKSEDPTELSSALVISLDHEVARICLVGEALGL